MKSFGIIFRVTHSQSQELVENLNQLFEDFKKDADAQVESGNKAAGTRARKTSLAIEKALKEFRKVSIEASK